MGATVVISAHDVLQFPEGGGHLSAYLQYVHGLHALGCDVWWLERLTASEDVARDRRTAAELSDRLGRAGLPDRLIVYSGDRDEERSFLTPADAQAEAVITRADLLLNFHYELDAELLARFARTALVDIDPGLLQLWVGEGHLKLGAHDLYFTTGDTVGTADARFPSLGIDWNHIRPPVSLDQWQLARQPPGEAFTTVSSWWSEEWVSDGQGGEWYENNKRVSFLEYVTLPGLVAAPLELALNVAGMEREDLDLLARHGWRVRPAGEVTATPAAYQSYVCGSTGEFSCAKPSCMRLQNAWVSDRTICYLASGRPAIVQHTGPSECLDGGLGILRFSTLEEAAAALEGVRGEYATHCAGAREVAEEWFDARKVVGGMLETALGSRGVSPVPPV